MRSYHKGWQSDRPLKPTSRRVNWYEPGQSDETIRLEFMDEYGKVNQFYDTFAKATYAFEGFIAGRFTTLDIRDEKKE